MRLTRARHNPQQLMVLRAVTVVAITAITMITAASPGALAGAAEPTTRSTTSISTAGDLTGISCPVLTFCAAVDSNGNLEESGAPWGSAAAWDTWNLGVPGLSAVSCVSATACIAISSIGGGANGEIVASNNATHFGLWAVRLVAKPTAGTTGDKASLSCVNASFCVAVDQSGNVAVLKNPTRASIARTAGRVGGAAFSTVNCPAIGLCVAGGANGLFVSTDPSAGARSWSPVSVDAGDVTGVACPSVNFCAAVTATGGVWTTGNPGSTATSSWNLNQATTHGFTAVSCGSPYLCSAGDATGDVWSAVDPGAMSAVWHSQPADPGTALTALSCRLSTLCVATDGNGRVAESTNPSSPGWGLRVIDPYGAGFMAGSCSAGSGPGVAQTRLAPRSRPVLGCAAVGAGVSYSTNGLDTATNWTYSPVGVGSSPGIAAVSCPSPALCAAAAGNAVETSADPERSTPRWTATDLGVGAGRSLTGVSCPATTLCVAVDSGGAMFWSSDPSSASPAWHPSEVAGFSVGVGISCPSTKLCVATGGDSVAVTTNPTGPGSGWRVTTVDTANNPLDGGAPAATVRVDCTAGNLCVVIDNSDNAIATADPVGSAPAWHEERVAPDLTAVTCTSSGWCGISDTLGQLMTSSSPARAGAVWALHSISYRGDVSGVSCATDTACVAVDPEGDVMSSTNPTGGESAWHLRHVLPASI
jgi:hypothetical protein